MIATIRAWLPIITLAIGIAFGLWFHSLRDKARELDAVKTEQKDTRTAIGENHERQLERAKENDARESREQDLTNQLGKAIEKEPHSYDCAVPADSVRILNSL